MKTSFIILTLIVFITAVACKKDKNKTPDTVKELYNIYKNGEINECEYNGEQVYSAGMNAYDAGNYIYDKDGNPIGTCVYATGMVDSICGQLVNCETVYRIESNIWGSPGVDKYELGN